MKRYNADLANDLVVVANLKPAKLRGVESQDMLLAAALGDTLKLGPSTAPSAPARR